MGDQFDREEFLSNTQGGRRRSADLDGTTRYPVRRPREPLQHTHRDEPTATAGADRERDLGETRLAQPRRAAEREERQSRETYTREYSEPSHTRIPYTPERHTEERYTREQTAKRSRAREDYTTQRHERELRAREDFAELPSGGGRAPHQAGKDRRRKRKRRGMSKLLKFLILLIIAVLVGVFCFRFMNRMMNPPAEEVNLSGQTVSVTIPEGAGTQAIAEILKENGLIRSVFGFKLTSKLEGFDGTYRQGTYEIDTGLTKRQIMELLQNGVVAQQITLTIPEGYNVRQIAQKVEETGICTAEEFINTSNTESFDFAFLADLPEREYRLEGYLFPDTYFLSENMTAADVVKMMLKRFDQMYSEKYQKAVQSSGYTLDEIVTIASMIEKEIKAADERPRAAGVIYNRLRDNMMLGIDATVLYAVGKSAGELTQEDLDIDSPYNTRNRYGLPLGPICNPSESAFEAALYPESNDYLYYVLEAAGGDHHVYCKTYDEFLAAKQAYQASL